MKVAGYFDPRTPHPVPRPAAGWAPAEFTSGSHGRHTPGSSISSPLTIQRGEERGAALVEHPSCGSPHPGSSTHDGQPRSQPHARSRTRASAAPSRSQQRGAELLGDAGAAAPPLEEQEALGVRVARARRVHW